MITWVWDIAKTLLPPPVNRKMKQLEQVIAADQAILAGLTVLRSEQLAGALDDDATAVSTLTTSTIGMVRVAMKGATAHVSAVFSFATAATSPVIVAPVGSSDVAAGDTDGDLCVFWNSGVLTIKNRLGESVDYMAIVEWAA